MGYLRRRADPDELILLIAIVAAVSYLGGSFGGQSYVAAVTMLVDLVLVVALYVFIGLSGVFSFGHVGFMAVGAYVTAIITMPASMKRVLFPSMPEFLISAHTGVVEGIVVGALSAGVVAALVSVPLMRLPGLSAALGTLVFLVVINDIASNWTSVTQGTAGMGGMPTPTTLNVAFIWAAVAITIAWLYKGCRSGLQLAASREDELAAEAVGVNVARHRRIAFTISAILAGLAGALFALQLGTLAPSSFFLDLTFLSIAMLVVGGQRSLSGAVIGTLLVSVVQQLLNSVENGQINLGFLSGRAGTPEFGVAILLLVILIARPSGLVGDREIGIPASWLRLAGHGPAAVSPGPAAEASMPPAGAVTDRMAELQAVTAEERNSPDKPILRSDNDKRLEKRNAMRQEQPVGLVLGSALPPERILPTAAAAERLGFQELWLAEDYFFTGGISAAAAVLASTSRVPVGLGVVSGLVRHPAVLGMEIATLARMFPNRIMPGIGLGLPNWLDQMGLRPARPLKALRDSVTMVKDLLSGSDVSEDEAHFKAAEVKLAYAPEISPPIYLGVVGPKMLELAGEIADGTVLSVLASPAYVSWSRERIRAGAQRAGRNGPHRVVTFALANVDTDRDRARRDIRELLAFYLGAMVGTAVSTVLGIDDELRRLTSDSASTLAQDMPEAWLDELAVAGDPDECTVRIRRLLDAGSDSVALFCAPPSRADETIRLAAEEIFPKL